MTNKSFIYNSTDVIWLMLGVLLIAIGVSSFTQWDKHFQASLPDSVATLKEVSNLVKVKNQNDLVWVKGDEGQLLTEDSLVYAGDFSRARIDFKNGSQVVIMPGSILRVYQDRKGQFKMRVQKGKAFKVTQQGVKTPIIAEEVIQAPALETTEAAPIPEPLPAPTLQLEVTGPRSLVMTDSKIKADFLWKIQEASDEHRKEKLLIELQTPSGEKLTEAVSLNQQQLSFKLNRSGKYQWMARFQDEVLEAGEFQVTQLYAPLIIRPKNRELPTSGTLPLEWSYGQGAQEFEVETTVGENVTTFTTNSGLHLLETLFNPKLSFSWRVRAKFQDQVGPWSEVARLWPAPPAEEKIIPETPALAAPAPRPVVNTAAISALVKPIYQADRLPLEIVIKDLPAPVAALAVFMDQEQIKAAGEDRIKVKIKKPGLYELSWYEIENHQLRKIHQTPLQVELNPLEDAINLPQEIVLELKDSGKK